MDAPTILPSEFHGKFPSGNFEIVKKIIDTGIDPKVFDLSSCKTFDCFLLLVESGCELDNLSVKRIFENACWWDLEFKKAFITYLMDNHKIADKNMQVFLDDNNDLRGKLDLDSKIFMYISSCAFSLANRRILFQMISDNYPTIKVNAQTFFCYFEEADILEPHYNFTSKELVSVFIDRVKHNNNDMWKLSKISKYCERDDYLSSEILLNLRFNRITLILLAINR
jgi:hypothetical protein